MINKEENLPFEIGGVTIPPGVTKTVYLPIAMIPHHSAFDLTLRIIHGRHSGKRLFISAGIHGDELNGIEVIRRVLKSPLLKHVRGTLIAIPVVNVFGMLTQSRYLPDRRDLNRSFPGSEKGSTASQLANIFLKEIVERCTHGIDLHTGSNNRSNLPQVRCDFESKEALNLALAFGAPVVLKSELREGSLREASEKIGIPTLTFEGGEALRFNEFAIREAVQGIFRVMARLGMIPLEKCASIRKSPVVSEWSHWLRAPSTGFFHSTSLLGKKVFKGEVVGKIVDSLGLISTEVLAHLDGIIVGINQVPIVFKGDALFNIACVNDPTKAEETIQELKGEAEFNPSLDDPTTY